MTADITPKNILNGQQFHNSITTPKGVTIFIRNDFPDHIRSKGRQWADSLEEDIKHAVDSGKKPPSKLSRTEYLSEIDRLARIAEKAISPDFDWNQYLPFTKAGNLPKDRSILVANSKCIYVDAEPSTCDYFSKNTLQLRLVPVYANTEQYLKRRPIPDCMGLVFDSFTNTDKTPPIFDENGIPSHPASIRNSYIKEKDLRPGCVYKSGRTDFLYLGRIKTPIAKDSPFATVSNLYIRYTKTVSKTVEKCTSLTEIFQALADPIDFYTFWEKVSAQTSPRKFTELVCCLLDTSQPVPETIDLAWNDGNTETLLMLTDPNIKPDMYGRVPLNTEKAV